MSAYGSKPRSEGTFEDVYGDHEPTHDFCPECSIGGGITRQQAFDAYFATGRISELRSVKSILVVRRIKRNFVTFKATASDSQSSRSRSMPASCSMRSSRWRSVFGWM